jgi:hypothetical protein
MNLSQPNNMNIAGGIKMPYIKNILKMYLIAMVLISNSCNELLIPHAVEVNEYNISDNPVTALNNWSESITYYKDTIQDVQTTTSYLQANRIEQSKEFAKDLLYNDIIKNEEKEEVRDDEGVDEAFTEKQINRFYRRKSVSRCESAPPVMKR